MNKYLLPIFEPIGSAKRVLVLVSLIAIFSAVDSQFIRLSYGTNLGRPDNFHLLLFTALTIAISSINAILLLSIKSSDIRVTGNRKLPLKSIYIGISISQYMISFILFVMILQMAIFSGYNKTFSLIIVLLSHFSSAAILSIISFVFLDWLRSNRSFSVIIYGFVFITILFLNLITVGFLIEQVDLQPTIISPMPYSSVILDVLPPSATVSFIQELGKYVFPILVVSSWIITVSLLRQYAKRIGRLIFWIAVSVPLAYQIFAFIVSDANIITDPYLVDIVYSKEFQLFLGINNQISGLFFGIAFLIVGTKINRKQMRNYLMISCIGIVSLFCSMPQTLVLYAAFPPFGLATFLLLGLSCYLLFVGIVGSAMYISRDTEFRRQLQKGLGFDSELLKNMGIAEIQREARSRVESVLKQIESQEEASGPLDLEENKEDIKMIIEEVINEIHPNSSGVM